jgi:hypothetical protein
MTASNGHGETLPHLFLIKAIPRKDEGLSALAQVLMSNRRTNLQLAQRIKVSGNIFMFAADVQRAGSPHCRDFKNGQVESVPDASSGV